MLISYMQEAKHIFLRNFKKQYLMKHKAGFLGCDQNDNKQVFPIQGWIVSPSTQADKDSTL